MHRSPPFTLISSLLFPAPLPKKKGGDTPGEGDVSSGGGGSPKPVKPTPSTPSAPPIESLKGPS